MPAFTTYSDLKTALEELGYPLKPISGARIAVLVEGDRTQHLKTLTQTLGGTLDYSSAVLKASSVGAVKYGQFYIFVKPAKRQGSKSAGVENELQLNNSINQIIKDNVEPLHIIFKDEHGNKTFSVDKVESSELMGRFTSGRRKADIILKTSTGKIIPISIKKDNAEMWESADSFYGQTAANYVRRLSALKKVRVKNLGSYYFLEPNFAIPANAQEKRNVIFGSDILEGKGCVVFRTFREQDFSYDGRKSTLTIRVSKIIENVNDIDRKYNVWFLVRNDRTRTMAGIQGLRVLAVPEKRINPNVLRVSANIKDLK